MKKEEITLKNTKAEILEALNDALKREKDLAKTKSNPVLEAKVKEVTKAIETTRVNVEQKIFSEELNNKFRDLEIALKAEEERLKNLYGIEKELNDMTLVVNAGKDFIMKLENDKKEAEDKLNASIKELEENHQLRMKQLQSEYDLAVKNLTITRERETEEYTYKVKRERELDQNKWEDEKQVRLNKIKNAEEEASKLLEEAKANAEQFKTLEKQVKDFPALLEKEYARGSNDKAKELERDHKYKIELLTKDFTNTIDRQNDKINLLQEEIEKLGVTNKALQEKMDQAYNQIKELATKTVEATGGLKILNNSQLESK